MIALLNTFILDQNERNLFDFFRISTKVFICLIDSNVIATISQLNNQKLIIEIILFLRDL